MGGIYLDRVILHSDLNSFYASVEALYRPDLRDKPIAVSGDPKLRHGIILTANRRAKERGVKTGEAIWQAEQKCPGLVTLPPDYRKYLRFSRMARKIYLDYTDQVEPFGIDEAWLDVTGSVGRGGTGERVADEIRRRMREELGITASVGASFNKVFAKLGSDYRKPDATTAITKENFKELVWPLPAGDLLYVGPATQKKLYNRGVRTIGEIAKAGPKPLGLWLGKWGEMLWRFASGKDRSPVCVQGEEAVVKSVGNSATTPRDLTTDEEVRMILYILSDSVAERLREQGFRGEVVSVSIRDAGLLCYGRQKKLSRATCLTSEIAEAAYALFGESYRWTRPVRSVGVQVSELTGDGAPVQLDLFCDQEKRERAEELEKTVDWLRGRFGHDAVRRAAVLSDQAFARMDPKGEHTIHPVSYLKGGGAV